MLDVKERKIGDVTYQVTQLPAPTGRKLLVRLYKVLGPSIGAALKGIPDKGKISIGDLEISAIGDALMSLANHLSEDDLEYLISVFTETTMFSREPGKWLPLKTDDLFHWAGRYHYMFQWIGFCLETNYSDFLSAPGGIGGLVSGIRKNPEPASPSPDTSIGKSIA